MPPFPTYLVYFQLVKHVNNYVRICPIKIVSVSQYQTLIVAVAV